MGDLRYGHSLQTMPALKVKRAYRSAYRLIFTRVKGPVTGQLSPLEFASFAPIDLHKRMIAD